MWNYWPIWSFITFQNVNDLLRVPQQQKFEARVVWLHVQEVTTSSTSAAVGQRIIQTVQSLLTIFPHVEYSAWKVFQRIGNLYDNEGKPMQIIVKTISVQVATYSRVYLTISSLVRISPIGYLMKWSSRTTVFSRVLEWWITFYTFCHNAELSYV